MHIILVKMYLIHVVCWNEDHIAQILIKGDQGDVKQQAPGSAC